MPIPLKTRQKILFWMEDNASHFEDCGEIVSTKLAEACAEEFDCLEWLDDELHPVWDIAVDVAIKKESA